MKKSLLLFLAISSLSFAAASVTGVTNSNKTNTADATSASINVNVSATVTGGSTQLVITDDNGAEISSVDFEHNLTQTGTELTGETVLNQIIYANATGISKTGLNFGDFNSNGDYALTNSTNEKETINGSLSIIAGDLDNNGVKHTLNSTIVSNNIAGEGTYSTVTKTLTMTFNKTRTK